MVTFYVTLGKYWREKKLWQTIKFHKQIISHRFLVEVLHSGQSYHLLLSLTLRRLMSYIYGAPILDVSRSHTTTQHSR